MRYLPLCDLFKTVFMNICWHNIKTDLEEDYSFEAASEAKEVL